MNAPLPTLLRLALSLAVPATAGAAATPAANAAAQSAAAHIEFDNTIFDFGKVKSGEVVKHGFIFTNTGTATLEILDVKPGCGCTTAGTWDKTVEPGKTGVIPLQFNSTGFGGSVSKTATVTCNDPVKHGLLLQLSGTVWKPIDVMPQLAMFNVSSEMLSNETRVVRITNNEQTPLLLSDLDTGNAAFQAELKTLEEGKVYEVRVTAVPPFTNNTVISTVTVKTSSSEVPVLRITAYALVQPVLAPNPQTLTLPPGPFTNPFTASVTVRNNGTNVVSLSDAKLSVPGVPVELKTTQPGQVFTVSATFPAGFNPTPGQLIELSVRTSHPKFPVLKVPVFPAPAAAVPGTTASASAAHRAGS